MNGERFVGICRQFAGKMNESWGAWTGEPQRVAAGRRVQMFAEVQQRRGLAKEESERQLNDFLARKRDWRT